MTNLRGAIPAVPLLLTPWGNVDWRAENAVLRYYLEAGIDGLAVGVHTTQFELHDDPGLLRAVWQLAAELARNHPRPITLIAGVCGDVEQSVREADMARSLGFDAALLCAYGMADVSEQAILDKTAAVGEILPGIGFYLQESVGGRYLSAEFWRRTCDIESLIGVKAAPFDRYRTREVAEAVLRSDRWRDIAFLTGNDDAIVTDLVTPHHLAVDGTVRTLRCEGGLLGQFAVGTRAATRIAAAALAVTESAPTGLLAEGAALTAVNAAVFDARHGFSGCVAGVNEVLRQQGFTQSGRCLSEREILSPGQASLIEAARADYPDLTDEAFIAANIDRWLTA